MYIEFTCLAVREDLLLALAVGAHMVLVHALMSTKTRASAPQSDRTWTATFSTDRAAVRRLGFASMSDIRPLLNLRTMGERLKCFDYLVLMWVSNIS